MDQIGEEAGLSGSACQRRLSRLRSDKVIRGDVAIVDPEKVGKNLTMIINVVVEREGPEVMNQFKQAMRAHPHVMQCYYVTGDTDFVLVVSVRDMSEYESFLDEFCINNSAITRFSTAVVVDKVKVGLVVQVNAEE